MNYLNLNEEQRRKLANEINNLLLMFKNNLDIKCIYLMPLSTINEPKDYTLVLMLVSDIDKIKPEFKEKIKELNEIYRQKEIINKFNLHISIDMDDVIKYTLSPKDNSEILRNNYLYNSTILFDSTGQYSQMKKETETTNKKNYYYFDTHAKISKKLTKKFKYNKK